MAITNLTGTKWLLEQGWTATSGFGLFSISGVVYDTNDSLVINEINGFNIGYIGFNFDLNSPVSGSNAIHINGYPTVLTSGYYYEFEITGGTDVTNTTLINWLEANATQIIEPSGYTITFETNGGSTISDIEEATELPTPLPTPTKSGYTFVNWYYDSAFTQIANAGDTIESNVTLYAKWELNTYTITYEENGGSSVPQTSNATQLPNPLPTTTKANHVFAGWYYDDEFTNEATAGDSLSHDVTLYAKWLGINQTRQGSDTPSKYYVGSNEVDRIYLGSDLVYEKATAPSGFTVTLDVESGGGYLLSSYYDRIDILQYSIDNGINWVDIDLYINTVISNVSTIKFKGKLNYDSDFITTNSTLFEGNWGAGDFAYGGTEDITTNATITTDTTIVFYYFDD